MNVLLKPFTDFLSKPWWLFLKECSVFLGSNIAPLCLGIIFFLCGVVSTIPYQTDAPDTDVIRILFHMFYILILASAIFLAMSSFVNERRQGTLELLYTLPISDIQLVLGKFFMGLFLMTSIVLSMSIIYIFYLGDAPWYIALSGCFGLLLVGLYAYSVGIFASSLTDNHLLSLLISTLIIALIDVGGYLSGLLPSPAKEIISHFHGLNQFIAFTRGVISLRGIVFFLSLTVLFLFLAVKVLKSRRWRGSNS